ncbi:MAG: PQQ-binding-like beta-propeller repeat protein [Planctomycetaceae bacterium]|nr:PQQ-binding-like beta-propeller repeat protein [Planctomycetaceae bacterium]
MTIKKKNAITGIWAVAVLLSALAFSTRAEPPQPVLTPPQQVGAPAVAGDQQPNSAAAKPAVGIDRWTYFRGNALSQGVANTTLPEKPVLLWKYEVPAGAFEVTAAIVDGVVYIGDLDGALVALNLTTGKVIWKTTIESGFVSSPAYLNGNIYLGDYDGVFYCFNTKDGSLVWKYETGAEVSSSANFYKDNVLVGSQDATLYCINSTSGKLTWKHELADQIRCSPTVVGDRTFVAGCDAKLHIIDLEKGEKISAVDLDGPTGSTPAVVGDHVFFGTEGASIYSINWRKSEINWHYTSEESALPYRSSVALKDDILIIGGRNRLVQAFNTKTGKELWQFKANGRVDASPVIVGNRVFTGSSDGRIHAFNLKTGKQVWQYEAGGDFAAAPAIAEQSLVIASGDGKVYCFGEK